MTTNQYQPLTTRLHFHPHSPVKQSKSKPVYPMPFSVCPLLKPEWNICVIKEVNGNKRCHVWLEDRWKLNVTQLGEKISQYAVIDKVYHSGEAKDGDKVPRVLRIEHY